MNSVLHGLFQSGELLDGIEFRPFLLLGPVQIPSQLQVQPEIGGRPEKPRQAQGCAWSDPPLAIDQLVDALIGNMDRVGQFTLSQVQGDQKLLCQHLARMSRLPVCRYANHFLSLVIVSNLHGHWTRIAPLKTDPILAVDPDAVLPFPVSRKSLQAIARRYIQFIQTNCRVQLIEFPDRDLPDDAWTQLPGGFRVQAIENVLRARIFERHDHQLTIARNPCYLMSDHNANYRRTEFIRDIHREQARSYRCRDRRDQAARLLKYSMVRGRPSSRGMVGCQPSLALAWAMSGQRWVGSSCGRGW
jgi:hypothetical protein